MKTRILLMAMLLLGGMAHAQTIEVNGTQTGVWDADTVLVTGNVTVPDSLRVLPGTVVLFDGFYAIAIDKDAVFTAQGTASDSIVFTVADTTGLCIYNSGRGGWNGFQMRRAGKVQFDYCVFEYAKASDTTDMSGGAMRIDWCDDVEIRHSTFHFNRAREHGGAVSAENSHVVMTDCKVNDNQVFIDDNIYTRYGGALRFLKCDVELRWMEFLRNNGEGCIGGAVGLDSCALVLDHAVFADNVGINGGGLYLVRSNHLEGRLSNLLFNHNHTRHFGGGLAFADCSPEVYNITVTGNSSEGVNCNGIFFYQYCSPKLTNCIIYGNYPTSEMVGQGDTIQMWLWTFEDYCPEFRNCLIENGMKSITYSGVAPVFEDIVDADPLFCSPEDYDFRLQAGSPCIDAGNPVVPDFMADGLCLGGMTRVSNGRIDIGAYEYSAHQVPETPETHQDATLFGNPLGSQSRVEFVLGRTGPVTVQVYGLTGNQVASLSLGRLQAGRQTVSLAALADLLKPGLYFLEIRTPEQRIVLKAVR